ncbi:hypothetical protein B0H12DRAFT_1149233, partial [Mycena haematopus]
MKNSRAQRAAAQPNSPSRKPTHDSMLYAPLALLPYVSPTTSITTRSQTPIWPE